jgi:type I restriction enzyme S subunit
MKKGWEIKKLSEVYDVRDGTHDSPEYVNKGYALITSKNLKEDRINYDKVNYISKEDYININKRSKVDIGDVLFAMIGTIGNPVVVLENSNFAIKNVALFKVPKDQNSNYLKYYLDSPIVISKMLKDAKGATQKFVGLGYLRNFEISLPKLSEQQEIVLILDDAFESIERAKLNAEQNLRNARELFDSYLQNIFEKGNWVETTLEKLSNKKDAIVSGPFGSNLKVSDYKENGVPILRLQNIGKGYFINKSIKFITKEKAEELKYHSFETGDIALAKLGIPIGKTCIIPESFENGIITADVVRIRPDKNVVNYKFLEYFLNTNISVAQLTGNISGATRPRVNLSDVRNIKLNLPKLDEQKKIVIELDNLTMKIKKLEEILNQKIICLEELKKSILQKAFNGELKTSKIST